MYIRYEGPDNGKLSYASHFIVTTQLWKKLNASLPIMTFYFIFDVTSQKQFAESTVY